MGISLYFRLVQIAHWLAMEIVVISQSFFPRFWAICLLQIDFLS